MISRRGFLTMLAGLGLTSAVANAAPVTRDEIGDHVQTMPKGQLPDFADPPELRELYRYALEHKVELQYIPCTCGCGRFGHKDNRHCYVKAEHGDGRVTFTSHAAT